MSAKDLITSQSKHFVKTITFTGASGLGLVNTDVVAATITGRVLMQELGIFCSADLTESGGATLSLGTDAAAASMIAATTVTTMDAGEHWNDTSIIFGVAAVLKDLAISSNLLMEVLTGTVTGGVLEVSILWSPLSLGGNIT